MRAAIHQPQYLPWLGYFDKMDQSDIFVLLDDVQYKKNEWQNRNRIRTPDGWQWLTVPVIYKFGQLIKDIKIDKTRKWGEKHLKSISINYSKALYFDRYFPFFEESLGREWTYLMDINNHFIEYFRKELGIKAPVVLSSGMGIKTNKTQRLIDICKSLNADVYLSGGGGADYLEQEKFEENNISLEFQNYIHPAYGQAYGGFCPYLSIADLLFCRGGDSINVIREGRQ
ncbi:MAG: WbqC family protein [Candidatus Omnitrophota bacterium]